MELRKIVYSAKNDYSDTLMENDSSLRWPMHHLGRNLPLRGLLLTRGTEPTQWYIQQRKRVRPQTEIRAKLCLRLDFRLNPKRSTLALLSKHDACNRLENSFGPVKASLTFWAPDIVMVRKQTDRFLLWVVGVWHGKNNQKFVNILGGRCLMNWPLKTTGKSLSYAFRSL